MQPKRLFVILAVSAGALVVFQLVWRGRKQPVSIAIERLVVEKSKRRLLAYANGELVKTYTIALGRNPVGAKQTEGDNKTPEGVYFIDGKNPGSKFHKNLGISYPNDRDRELAHQRGELPGGEIKIHGQPNGCANVLGNHYYQTDWTAGCIALTDYEIDELYQNVGVGTPIEIRP